MHSSRRARLPNRVSSLARVRFKAGYFKGGDKVDEPVKNYFRIRRLSLINCYYCYVDLPDYYADNLFIKHRVTVDFGEEWAHPDEKYLFIFCRCRRWRRHSLVAALRELPYIMALNGHGDYDDFCNKYVARLDKDNPVVQGKDSRL